MVIGMDGKKTKTVILAVGIFVVILAAVVAAALMLSGRDGGDYENVDVSGGSPLQSASTEETAASGTSAETEAGRVSIQAEGDNAEGKLDISLMAQKAYEWRFLFAQESFESPAELSVNKLVQYAFSHLYYDSMLDMPSSGLTYRETTPEQIGRILEQEFGLTGVDVTKSDLYNPETGKVEMWQPNFNGQVFGKAVSRKTGDTTYEIAFNFYTNASKTSVKGEGVLTVQEIDERFILTKLQ